ncbi:MAG: hypothetical protein JNM99_16785 [Verrucomicrobiaceae bacterium]|nr:hypothetical protein [Verrucomicrobiaceae bacterium]
MIPSLASQLSPGELDELGSMIVGNVIDSFGPSDWQLLGVKRCLSQAYDDARQLDAWATSSAICWDFRNGFVDSLKQLEAANAFFQVGRLAWDAKATREIQRASREGRDTTLPLLTYGLRELLRDGWNWQQVRAEKAKEQIEDALQQGLPGAFAAIGAVEKANERKPLMRSAEGWILRAWLPLALWRCQNNGEIEMQVRRAYDLLVSIDVPMPPLPAPTAFFSFVDKVRHRLKAGIRR